MTDDGRTILREPPIGRAAPEPFGGLFRPMLGSGLPGHRIGVGPEASQELTMATASISIMKSGPPRRVTPTVVLVGVATPR